MANTGSTLRMSYKGNFDLLNITVLLYLTFDSAALVPIFPFCMRLGCSRFYYGLYSGAQKQTFYENVFMNTFTNANLTETKWCCSRKTMQLFLMNSFITAFKITVIIHFYE